MNKENQEDYDRLVFEDNISVILIILSILNIKANQIIEEALINKKSHNIQKALQIYRFISAVSILIYLYFVLRNYNFYQATKNDDKKVDENNLEKIRLIGSILIFIGTLMLAYVSFNQKEPMGEVEIG